MIAMFFYPSYVKKVRPSVIIFEFPYVKILSLSWIKSSVRENFTQTSYVKMERSMREKKNKNIQLKRLCS